MLLTDRDTYQTGYSASTWRAGLLRWTRLALHLPVLYIIIKYGIMARRGRYDDKAWARSAGEVLDALEAAGIQVTAEGLQHLRELEGPAVFVGNHMSTLETFVLPAFIRPLMPVTFVVKESLLRYPVFGAVMRSRDPITVGRSNPREDLAAVLKGGQERLQRGVSIIVFPQTTRSSRFDPSQFNSIGAKLAARAHVPVMPVALRTDAWGNGKRLKDFGPVDPDRPVRLRFGPPIPAEGKGGEAHRRTESFIRSALREWDVEVVGEEG